MSELVGGCVQRKSGNISWFEPVEPIAGIGHVVMTTRGGGLSKEPYTSLNVGLHVGDVEERVRLNRKSVLTALDRRLLEPVVGDQVHGVTVRHVGELHAGTRWQQNESALAETDALMTATRRLPLVTLVADCLPLALIDPVRGAAAVVHGGWRGLAEGIVENTLEGMRETWGTVPADVVAWLGPCIGDCCYEVGPEVAQQFPTSVQSSEADRSKLSIRHAAQSRLRLSGLNDENITGLDLCTACHPELFFSHRRTTREGGSITGRQAMLVWLEPSLRTDA